MSTEAGKMQETNQPKMTAWINIEVKCSSSLCIADAFWDEVKAEANKPEVNIHETDGTVTFMQYDANSRELSHTIAIHADRSWTAKMYRYTVPKDHEYFASIPELPGNSQHDRMLNLATCLKRNTFADKHLL